MWIPSLKKALISATALIPLGISKSFFLYVSEAQDVTKGGVCPGTKFLEKFRDLPIQKT